MLDHPNKAYVPGVIEAAFARTSGRRLDHDTVVLLLVPGLTPALMCRLLGTSIATIRNWRLRANAALTEDSSIGEEVRRLSESVASADGLWLARNRGAGHLCYWSRLAVKAMREDGLSYDKLGAMFDVHPLTASNVCKGRYGWGFDALSGVRRCTAHQAAPSGRWVKQQ